MHDLGLVMAAIVLADAGWRVDFLGVHTPGAALGAAIERSGATVVVVCAYDRRLARRFLEQSSVWHRAGLSVVAGGRGFIPADARVLERTLIHSGSFRDLPGAVDATSERPDP